MEPSVIKGSQFILRPFKKGDERLLVSNLNNKKVLRKLLTVPDPYTIKDAKCWVDLNIKEYKKIKSSMICFVIDIDGNACGSVGLHNIVDKHMAEVGYWLAEQYWKKGIMTEVIKLITKFGFEKIGFKRLYAYTFIHNTGSQKALMKNGYKFEGKLRKHAYKNGKFIDDFLYAKIK